MTISPPRLSIADFKALLAQPQNRGKHLELVNGEVSEKMVSEVHGILVMYIGAMLLNHVLLHRLGRVTTEVHHHAPNASDTVYQPDIAFTRAERAHPPTEEAAVPQMPDLVVEVKTVSNTYRELRDKAAYYLAHGARLVWVVPPAKHLVEVYRADGDIDLLGEADHLDGGEVVPGFSLSIKAVFDALN
jgi:Uma2 family endonuclease